MDVTITSTFRMVEHSRQVPRCTFTHPEVATVGLTLAEAHAQLGAQVSAKLRHLEQVDRAICEGREGVK